MAGQSCCCGAPRLVFACSGAADVGKISDDAARALIRTSGLRMGCLPLISMQDEGTLAAVESAAEVVTIDGCQRDCAYTILATANRRDHFVRLRVTDFGLRKGSAQLDQNGLAALVGRMNTQLKETASDS